MGGAILFNLGIKVFYAFRQIYFLNFYENLINYNILYLRSI